MAAAETKATAEAKVVVKAQAAATTKATADASTAVKNKDAAVAVNQHVEAIANKPLQKSRQLL